MRYREEALQPNPRSRRRGADVPGPKSGVHGQGRVCMHQSCAAVPSAFLAVVRRWSCSYSSRALVVPHVDLVAVLRLLLFGMWLGLPVWWARLLPAFCVGRVSLPPGEDEWRSASSFLVGDFCRCWALVSGSTWSSSISIVSVFGPFLLRHFPSCGAPARWRDLRHVVLTFGASSLPSWRVASEFF